MAPERDGMGSGRDTGSARAGAAGTVPRATGAVGHTWATDHQSPITTVPKAPWPRRDTGRYGGGPRRVLSAMGKRRTWPTWATDGPLKKRQVGHRKAKSALAKRCFRHKIDKNPRKPFQGIRGGVTPVASRPSWSAQPTALDPPGPPLPSVGALTARPGVVLPTGSTRPPVRLPSLRSGALCADALRGVLLRGLRPRFHPRTRIDRPGKIR